MMIITEVSNEKLCTCGNIWRFAVDLQLLAEAFFNLASNAEEFNRFEEASNFRKSASECERLERLNRQKTRWNELKQHWNKER